MKNSFLFPFSLLALLAASPVAMSAPDNTPKHGSASDPISRQYKCFNDGGFYDPGEEGKNIPNEACRAAFLAGDKQAWQRAALFENWPAYSQNLEGQPAEPPYTAKVPDGQLCSAGMEKNHPDDPQRNYTGIDLPSDKWYVSEINVNNERKTQLIYKATQSHEPSKWWVYVSKPDFNPDSQSLKWDDLMKVTVDKVTLVYDDEKSKIIVYPDKPTEATTKATKPGTYYIDVTLPEGFPKEKHAILYMAWERQDPARETFFSCSDVNLKPAS